MEEQIKNLNHRDDGFLEVSLHASKDFDEYVLAQMCKDSCCLSVIRDHKSKLTFYYDTNGYIHLLSYLQSHHFEEDEILDFLIYLFEHLVRVNTNKPVYLQSDCIYLSYDGTLLKFLVLPLAMDKWIFQRDQSRAFVEELISELKGTHIYQVIGFLVEHLKGKEVSFPLLLQGLHELKQDRVVEETWIQKLFKKQKDPEPFIVKGIVKPAIMLPPCKEPEELFMETMVLFAKESPSFVDQKTKAIYFIETEPFTIGRSSDNELSMNDTFMSAKHARFYLSTNTLEDLDSSNGTYVNQKKITSVSLQHGDIVSFANHEFQFQCQGGYQ